MSEREESYSTDVEEFSESGGSDPSDSSRISSHDIDGNEELGVHICMSSKETPKAMLTFYYFMKNRKS